MSTRKPTKPPAPHMAAIDRAMQEQGKSRADLGRHLGLGSEQVSRTFSGDRRLQLHEAREIERWLGINVDGDVGAPTILPMPGLVPLYGWVGASSDERLILAEQGLRAYVPMHPAQINVRDPFALEVADISMIPRYEPGEIVYLAPNRWPARGQDCVLVTKDGHGLLKRFIRREPEKVVLHQLNPLRDIDVEAANIEAIHTVVGRN
jgi:phage repressor protein C with HTH and peptisase S24 domain